VERAVQYVRGNFFVGEEFVDLADAQARAERWCREVAGARIHGTIQARPVEVFTECEASVLLPVPEAYDVPIFTRVKVHRDFHLEVGKALYSAPKAYLGQHLDIRADSALVKLFHQGQLVKVHPRQQPGGRISDPQDLPEHKAGYALRDLESLIATATKHGPEVGTYTGRLLEGELPWTRMRQVYRLLALARRYGDEPVNTACARALALDVINVTKITSMLEQASENTPPPPPPPVAPGAARFARDPAEFTPYRPALTLINGGEAAR
jgi:Mu transposase, C-terminal domain